MADGGNNLIMAVTSVSPLALAAMTGALKDIVSCLEAGTKVDEKDSNGWTALHFAAAQGQTQSVSSLLSQGADPAAKTNIGATAKEIAMHAGHIDASVVLDKAEETGQVILQRDLPDHVKDLKKQVADLTEKFNELAARFPAPPQEAKPASKAPSLFIPGKTGQVTL